MKNPYRILEEIMKVLNFSTKMSNKLLCKIFIGRFVCKVSNRLVTKKKKKRKKIQRFHIIFVLFIYEIVFVPMVIVMVRENENLFQHINTITNLVAPYLLETEMLKMLVSVVPHSLLFIIPN